MRKEKKKLAFWTGIFLEEVKKNAQNRSLNHDRLVIASQVKFRVDWGSSYIQNHCSAYIMLLYTAAASCTYYILKAYCYHVYVRTLEAWAQG